MLMFWCKDKSTVERIKSCRERLYRIAYSWCHDQMLADDLVQDTLSRAMLKIDQLKNEESMDAWLFAILNNQWREHLRRSKPCEDIDDIVYKHDKTPEYWHRRQQDVDQVQQALAELTLSQRQIISLVDIEGMSYARVSAALQIPVGTVMSRLSRARSSLQQKLQKKDRMSSVLRIRSVK